MKLILPHFRYLLQRSILPVLLFGFITVSAQGSGDDGWKLAKEKDGITIYTRVPEGSKLKEYKAETIVDVPPERVLNVLTNADRYADWMSGIKETRLLKTEGDSVFYIYARLGIPWPFDDRDEVSRSCLIKDTIPGGYFMPIRIVTGMMPKIKGVVRMTNGKGYWLMEPLSEGKTRVVQQFIGDPGGSMPAWIVNIFIVDSPYKSLLGLKKEALRKEK